MIESSPLSRRERSREKQLRATAFHEAGHAAVSLYLGRAVRSVDVVPEEDRLGVCRGRKLPAWLAPDVASPEDWRHRRLAEIEVLVLLSGRLAEARVTGRRNNVGASHDDAMALDYLTAFSHGIEEAEAWLSYLEIRAENILGIVWAGVEAIAHDLLARKRLTGDETREAYSRGLLG